MAAQDSQRPMGYTITLSKQADAMSGVSALDDRQRVHGLAALLHPQPITKTAAPMRAACSIICAACSGGSSASATSRRLTPPVSCPSIGAQSGVALPVRAATAVL